MKVLTPTHQYSSPESRAVPATPSCCCCCCCCVATIVSTSTIAGISANTDATVKGLPTGAPTALAALAQVAAIAALIGVLSIGVNGFLAAATAAVVGFAMFTAGFRQAGNEWSSSMGRAAKYVIIYVGAFALELSVGIFLLLLYVLPYVIVAGLSGYAVIKSQLQDRRRRLQPQYPPPAQWQANTAALYPPPPAGYLPGAPGAVPPGASTPAAVQPPPPGTMPPPPGTMPPPPAAIAPPPVEAAPPVAGLFFDPRPPDDLPSPFDPPA